MPIALSDIKKILCKIVYASIAYEVLHGIQLMLIPCIISRQDAAKYALFVCLITIVAKFYDAGAGTVIPRLLKVFPNQARSLGITVLQQACICVLFTLLGSSLFIHKFSQFEEKLYIIFLAAILEACSTLGRHVMYSTLQSALLIKTELCIMGIKTLTLLWIYTYHKNSPQILFIIFLVFLLINTISIMSICWYGIIRNAHPISRKLSKAMHKPLATLRLQLFSMKIGKDLLSTHVLTPLFTYAHGLDYTWSFFFLTSFIASLHAIIKMSIGYTASGIFSRLNEAVHEQALRKLNKYLAVFIAGALLIIASLYVAILTTMPLTKQTQISLYYAMSFGCLTLIDLVCIAYEQYFLLNGHYGTYQKLRAFEYMSLAALAILCFQPFGIVITTAILLIWKLFIFIIIHSCRPIAAQIR